MPHGRHGRPSPAMNWHVLMLVPVWLVLVLAGLTSREVAVFMADDL